MYHIVVVATLVIGSLIWGKWTRWKEYLPTIYYFTGCNLLYHYFCYMDKYLWRLDKHVFNAFFTESLYLFIVYPCLVVMFLGNYPNRMRSKWIHLLKYISISIILEAIAYKFGFITYINGWTLGWTTFFYVTMYPMLRLHYKRPLIAIILSVFFTAFYLLMFDFDLK